MQIYGSPQPPGIKGVLDLPIIPRYHPCVMCATQG